MSTDDWPFDQPRNCAVVTLKSIVFDNKPILLVVHDEDDHGWQFLDNEIFDPGRAALVGLKEIVSRDDSILELCDLPVGWCAWRNSRDSPWQRAPIKNDSLDEPGS